MWEAIARNRLRSRLLIALLGLLLVLVGGTIGAAIDPQNGAPAGMAAALIVWLVNWLAAVAAGDRILLAGAGARRIDRDDAPRLWNIVEEMTIAAGLAKMPAVYLIPDESPNAFAAGRRPDRAAVAVTIGLLRRLNRDELQGVIAHEIGHIRNWDIRFMTLAGVMMGSIIMLSDLFLRSLRYQGRRRRSGRSGGGQAQLVLLVVALVLAIVAPVLAQMLYFACSREREYLADASAARFTRYPEGLASALEKIASRASAMRSTNRVLAPMYIVNPLQAGGAAGLFATHPPTERRIAILRAMGRGASFVDYEDAFQKVVGARCLGERTLADEPRVPLREPSAGDTGAAEDPVVLGHEALEWLGRLDLLMPIPCACGITLRIASDDPRTEIVCPRCGRTHAVPHAEPQPSAVPAASQPPQVYRRQMPGRWESFRCRCGGVVQLSPLFASTRVKCPRCGSTIAVERSG